MSGRTLNQLASAKAAVVRAQERYQQALARCVAAGHDSVEIAARIGITPVAVRMTLVWREYHRREREVDDGR